ncbi:MAG: T9SS type A sorting domain-containing protein, partial [Muribaculaceae bacterium]|nr:T9SS type A sorting domain-containing protein [Muribaculaceae bacterium]
LYSVNGQLVAQGNGAGNNTVSVDFSGSPSGLYILMVSDSQGNKEIFKIIKN